MAERSQFPFEINLRGRCNWASKASIVITSFASARGRISEPFPRARCIPLPLSWNTSPIIITRKQGGKEQLLNPFTIQSTNKKTNKTLVIDNILYLHHNTIERENLNKHDFLNLLELFWHTISFNMWRKIHLKEPSLKDLWAKILALNPHLGQHPFGPHAFCTLRTYLRTYLRTWLVKISTRHHIYTDVYKANLENLGSGSSLQYLKTSASWNISIHHNQNPLASELQC